MKVGRVCRVHFLYELLARDANNMKTGFLLNIFLLHTVRCS